MSITHNKKRILLLNVHINDMSVRSAPQILSTKDEYTFIFLYYLITGLYNSSANSLSGIISFLIAPPEVYLPKNYKPLSKTPLIFTIF